MTTVSQINQSGVYTISKDPLRLKFKHLEPKKKDFGLSVEFADVGQKEKAFAPSYEAAHVDEKKAFSLSVKVADVSRKEKAFTPSYEAADVDEKGSLLEILRSTIDRTIELTGRGCPCSEKCFWNQYVLIKLQTLLNIGLT